MLRRPIGLFFGSAVLAAMTLAGCVPGPMAPMHPDMHGRAGGTASAAPSPRPGAPELVVVATDFSFEPSVIRLPAGESLNITLENRGRLFHDLTIADLGFVLSAEAGERASGSLSVVEPGGYPFECTVPGHAGAGMTGRLVVE